MPKRAHNSGSFEKSLEELEKLVETMESGDLPLEDALKQFERGVTLARACQKALKDAELKVEQLIEQNGQPTLAPLDVEKDDD